MTRLGIIARADNRGIAFQTEEMVKHLAPAKTMVVCLNDPKWPEDRSRFTGKGVSFVDCDRGTRVMDEKPVRAFLRGLDVVLAVETLYDWRMADWAHEAGVRTVVQCNPEFFVHHRKHDFAWPDQFVWPTEWLLDELPPGPILPVPVPDKAPVAAADPHDGPLRVLHVAGHAAAGDRNGTILFMQALTAVRQPVEVTVVGQDGRLPMAIPASNVTVHLNPDGVEDRWDLYRGHHLLVAPRRYGGLSLVTNEACRAGLAVAMPDCSPNRRWPIWPLPVHKGRLHRAPFGPVPTFGTTPSAIAHTIDKFAQNREALEGYMRLSTKWADQNSWSALKPMYDRVLA